MGRIIKTVETHPFAIMDDNLCYDRYETREEAGIELAKLRAHLVDKVHCAELDLEQHDEGMKVQEFNHDNNS